MIKFSIKNFGVKLDFSFFAVIALFFCFDYTGYGIYSIIACAIHETGHIVAMTAIGQPLDELYFYGAGVKIKAGNESGFSIGKQLFVLMGGSAFNLAVSFIFFVLSDGTSVFMPVFSGINLVIGVFNLLPIGCFDGRRILKLILIKWASVESVDNTLRAINIAVAAVLLIFGVVLLLDGFNFSVLITLSYIILITLTGNDG